MHTRMQEAQLVCWWSAAGRRSLTGAVWEACTFANLFQRSKHQGLPSSLRRRDTSCYAHAGCPFVQTFHLAMPPVTVPAVQAGSSANSAADQLQRGWWWDLDAEHQQVPAAVLCISRCSIAKFHLQWSCWWHRQESCMLDLNQWHPNFHVAKKSTRVSGGQPS